MTSTTTDMQVKTYIAAVAARLADLPQEEREDLMADLEQHLHEVAAEGEGTLTERLGTPEAYAAELRASAGLPSRDGDTFHRSWRDVAERIRRLPALQAAFDFLPELRSAWWLVRAGIVAAAMSLAVAGQSGRDTKVIFGFAAIALLAGPSIMLGRAARHSRAARWISILGNVPIVILGVALLSTVHIGDPPVYYEEYAQADYLHHEDMTPISNVCAYDSELSPIEQVLLFDQDGRPIDNVASVAADPSYNFAPSADVGRGFANAFPRDRELLNPETGATRSFDCPTLNKGDDARKKKSETRKSD